MPSRMPSGLVEGADPKRGCRAGRQPLPHTRLSPQESAAVLVRIPIIPRREMAWSGPRRGAPCRGVRGCFYCGGCRRGAERGLPRAPSPYSPNCGAALRAPLLRGSPRPRLGSPRQCQATVLSLSAGVPPLREPLPRDQASTAPGSRRPAPAPPLSCGAAQVQARPLPPAAGGGGAVQKAVPPRAPHLTLSVQRSQESGRQSPEAVRGAARASPHPHQVGTLPAPGEGADGDGEEEGAGGEGARRVRGRRTPWGWRRRRWQRDRDRRALWSKRGW